MRRAFRVLQRDNGVNLAVGALVVVVVAVVGGMAIDAAVYLAGVKHAQWEAEGMARAAAAELRRSADQEAALRAGKDWGYRNSVDLSKVECCAFGDMRPLTAPDGEVDTVTAVAATSHSTWFLRFFGLPEEYSSKRTATAQVVGAQEGAVCPWGVLGDPADITPQDGSYLGLTPGRVYVLDPAQAPQGAGDLLLLDLSGRGAAGYQDALRLGCREEDVGTIAKGEVARFLLSSSEMAGSTVQALSHHFAFEAADGYADYLDYGWCDVTFELDGQSAGAGHSTGFSPHLQPPRSECVKGTLDGGAGRIVLVPIVSQPPGDPGGAVRVLGLASMYILSWDRGNSAVNGGGEVYGMFLDRATVNAGGLDGEDDSPLAPLRVVLVD